MVKCDKCDKEVQDYSYQVSYPLLITKSQEMRGVVPSGDILLRVCNDCKSDRPTFHNPEFGHVKEDK